MSTLGLIMLQIGLMIFATVRTPLITKIINDRILKEGTWSKSFFDEYWLIFVIPIIGEILIIIIGIIQYIID